MESQKLTFGIIGLVLLVIGGIWLVQLKMQPASAPAPEPQAPVPVQIATSTYATTTLGVSAVYPQSYAVNEGYAYDQFGPKKLIRGVKFLIPETMATGTNLSGFDTGISIEQLPRAVHCTGDIYLKADVKAEATTINGVNYSVATSQEAAAGNRYEETIYALADSKPCTAVRYFIHSTAIENYDPATGIREFDRAALIKDFDSIRDSLRLTQ